MTPELTHDDLPPNPSLSAKQQKAAHMLALGWSYRRISAELAVSKTTIVNWRKSPEFLVQIGTLSSEITHRFQSRNLRAMGKAIRVLHAICFDERQKAADRLAAASKIIDLAINWHVIRPLEVSRHKLEAMGDHGP